MGAFWVDSYDEITFHETNPVNGLNFYLGKQLEEVNKNTEK